MSDTDDTLPAPGNTKPTAKTAAQRQAALRRRRQKEGRNQVVVWLTQEEQAKVKALLAGQLGDDSAKIAAERDALAVKLEKSRALNHELYVDVQNYQNEILVQEKTIQEFRLHLLKAENALKEKPAKTFVVPELPDRRAQIVKAMSHEDGWRGDEREMDTAKLKQQADLAKKFATEIKHARSRVASLVSITTGGDLLEQSKARTVWGGWNRFKAPIVSPAEKALLEEACVVMRRVESDVERAGNDVGKLHKQREAEDKARREAAAAALEKAIFNGLDHRGEVLFIAATNKGKSHFGDWADLHQAADGTGRLYGKSALEHFKSALREAKSDTIRRVTDAMKATGRSVEDLSTEIADQYRHPDTRAKYGSLAEQVTTFLVSEQLSRTN